MHRKKIEEDAAPVASAVAVAADNNEDAQEE